MKKIIFAIFAVALSFASCQNPEWEPGPDEKGGDVTRPENQHRVKRAYKHIEEPDEEGYTQLYSLNFTYDDHNRITKLVTRMQRFLDGVEVPEKETSIRVEAAFATNTVTVQIWVEVPDFPIEDPILYTIINLNGDGYYDSSINQYFQSQAYYKNGYLERMTEVNNFDGLAEELVYTDSFAWDEGNMMGMTREYEDGLTLTTTVEYNTRYRNSATFDFNWALSRVSDTTSVVADVIFNELGLMGKRSKNLITKATKTLEDGSKMVGTVDYTFDKQGRVTSIVGVGFDDAPELVNIEYYD